MSEDYFLNSAEKQALQSWHAWLDDNRGDRTRFAVRKARKIFY